MVSVMTLAPEPVLDRIVVSLIGLQWSPRQHRRPHTVEDVRHEGSGVANPASRGSARTEPLEELGWGQRNLSKNWVRADETPPKIG